MGREQVSGGAEDDVRRLHSVTAKITAELGNIPIVDKDTIEMDRSYVTIIGKKFE